MFVRSGSVHTLRRVGLISTCLLLVLSSHLSGAGKSPIKVLKFDPQAEQVALFDGLERGLLKVRVAPRDVRGGNLYIENLTDRPLSVDLPDAVAMVHVLKQVGNGFFNTVGGSGQFGANGLGNGASSGLTGQGQGSQLGGGQGLGASFGFGQQGQSGQNGLIGQNQLNGNGVFSIPADRVAQVPYQSVCLNYGRPDPAPRMIYNLVRLEDYTQDAVLQETLTMFGQGKLGQSAAQAAAWHLTNEMSWQRLASLTEFTLPGVYTSQVPIFSRRVLGVAQQAVETARKEVAKRPQPADANRPRVAQVEPKRQ